MESSKSSLLASFAETSLLSVTRSRCKKHNGRAPVHREHSRNSHLNAGKSPHYMEPR